MTAIRTIANMPANIRLVTIAPGADATTAVWHALACAPLGFGHTLWLTPAAATSAAIRVRLATDRPAVMAPQVFELQAFADEVVCTNDLAARPLTDVQRRLLLDAALAELREAGELTAHTETRGYADTADGLIRELKQAGVDPKRFARLSGGDDAARIYTAFERKRAKLRRLDPEDRQNRAAELWTASRRLPFTSVCRVAVVGFTRFTAPQCRLLAALAESVNDIVVSLPGDQTSDREEVFAALRDLRKAVQTIRGEANLFSSSPPSDSSPTSKEEELIATAFNKQEESNTAPLPPNGEGQTLVPSPSPSVEEPASGNEPMPRPAGLSHLAKTLFRPTTSPAAKQSTHSTNEHGSSHSQSFTQTTPPTDASGVSLIEAPGAVGEARLVSRKIRRLLLSGVHPESIVVTARHLNRNTDILREVFDEYDIPHEWPEPDRLGRLPAVAALLRAWRLPDEDFPFTGVAALLRSTFFRPDWELVRADPDLPMRAEALLRQVGESQGKDAFLAAVATWCDSPPVPLEDEQAEEPRRRRLQRLARRCRPFLERFFRMWDHIPRTATPVGFAERWRRLADDLGLSAEPGFAEFAAELARWVHTDWPAISSRKTVTKAAFTRMLATLAGFTNQPAVAVGGKVRVLPAEDARGADCDHLFIIGLGEGSFPDLSPPPSRLDDAARRRLRAAGVPLADPDGRLSAEMLLFVELVSRPRVTLHLCYAAVDEQGQPLLPSSFLLAVRECFAPEAIPVTRQRMTIEGYANCEPFSAAELRVRVAREMTKPNVGRLWADREFPLSRDVLDNLVAARCTADARFREREFGPFDGLLRHPVVVRDLAQRLGPAKVFSPTALEAYVACPFRFWLEHVLRLEPLDEPGDEVEQTRRGAAVHRALARFHTRVRDHAADLLARADLPPDVDPHLEEHLLAAVEEYAARAASPASQMLWRLEGKRLLRALARYRRHWDEFRKPWQEKNAAPTPHAFEADFGMPAEEGVVIPEPLVVQVGGVEVRIGGRIDRVDVTQLAGGIGFWVIDYKTGRGQHYTAAAIERFERLQLPLYAIAVEKVFFAGQAARPLGLAYWLVTGEGAKPVLPSRKNELLRWLTDAERWVKFRTQLEAWVATLVKHIRAGNFPLAPRSDNCTDTCRFGPVCRITQARSVGKRWLLPLPGDTVSVDESG
jgi:ATP-dependent helicase/DNAse subunit B